MQDMGRTLVIMGLLIAGLGAMLWLGFGRGWKLPGDIFIRKGDFTFAFPVVTCLVISAVLTLLSWLFRR